MILIATNINTYTNTIVIVKVYNNVNENDARYLYIYMKCAYFYLQCWILRDRYGRSADWL